MKIYILLITLCGLILLSGCTTTNINGENTPTLTSHGDDYSICPPPSLESTRYLNFSLRCECDLTNSENGNTIKNITTQGGYLSPLRIEPKNGDVPCDETPCDNGLRKINSLLSSQQKKELAGISDSGVCTCNLTVGCEEELWWVTRKQTAPTRAECDPYLKRECKYNIPTKTIMLKWEY